MTKWAVFDVDGTLFPPSSMEKSFLLYMFRNGILPSQNIFYYFLTGIIKTLQQNYAEGFKNNKNYLKYLPCLPVKRSGKRFVRENIWPRISPAGIERIQFYRSKKYHILIMSGSPDFLTYPLTPFIQPDYVIAADLEIKGNRYTGQLSGLHPYGERKSEILLKLQNKIGIDFSSSVVFANHTSDFYHMSLFGKAVAVNPTEKLKRKAHQQNWPIEIWE